MVANLRNILLGILGFACTADIAVAAAHSVPRCRGNPGVIGRCYWVRGEFSLSGDSLFIVDRDDNGAWVVIRGARGLHGAGPVQDDGPRNLEMSFDRAVKAKGSIGGAFVRGDFEVCPIPNDGSFPEQKFACIQTATNLRPVSPHRMSPARKRNFDQGIASGAYIPSQYQGHIGVADAKGRRTRNYFALKGR